MTGFLNFLVGVQGFEPWTPWSQTRCATRLRHTPPNLKYSPKFFVDGFLT